MLKFLPTCPPFPPWFSARLVLPVRLCPSCPQTQRSQPPARFGLCPWPLAPPAALPLDMPPGGAGSSSPSKSSSCGRQAEPASDQQALPVIRPCTSGKQGPSRSITSVCRVGWGQLGGKGAAERLSHTPEPRACPVSTNDKNTGD